MRYIENVIDFIFKTRYFVSFEYTNGKIRTKQAVEYTTIRFDLVKATTEIRKLVENEELVITCVSKL